MSEACTSENGCKRPSPSTFQGEISQFSPNRRNWTLFNQHVSKAIMSPDPAGLCFEAGRCLVSRRFKTDHPPSPFCRWQRVCSETASAPPLRSRSCGRVLGVRAAELRRVKRTGVTSRRRGCRCRGAPLLPESPATLQWRPTRRRYTEIADPAADMWALFDIVAPDGPESTRENTPSEH